ncbi:hypothetical protein [Anaeromyxobacter oryzae]|uniref:Secreted protein n=1 Tax=Anaeromyxobacter oryzae TaxID=2918170 RepID=A0ABM7X4E0_9BACT|nr:hypothetical protein [Anaeromyxobacter oryzae]BDG06674.1 hypothetical protein AMOR_56700 [Anaeromyxobacter oryzae]
MRKLVAMLVVLGMPAVVLAETWQKVPIVDHMCLNKVKDDTSKHPTSCLLKCASSGYSVKTADGWLKLDDKGNQDAVAALKKTAKKEDIRVDVSGEKKGDTIQVTSLTIPD